MEIALVREADYEAVAALVNRAYRGEASRAGWTTEADIISGEKRTDVLQLKHDLSEPGAVMLKAVGQDGLPAGVVYLRLRKEGLYLGMLSVDPVQQAGGIGRSLLEAAERYARQQQAWRIYMTVISIRTELIAWYIRRGYHPTGKVMDFPENNDFGKPLLPLSFAELEKHL